MVRLLCLSFNPDGEVALAREGSLQVFVFDGARIVSASVSLFRPRLEREAVPAAPKLSKKFAHPQTILLLLKTTGKNSTVHCSKCPCINVHVRHAIRSKK